MPTDFPQIQAQCHEGYKVAVYNPAACQPPVRWLTCGCVCVSYVCVRGERRCVESNQPQPCLNSGPDCVYTVGMIYVSWTSSRSASDVSQMRVSIIPPRPGLLREGEGMCY